jgi:hypothetical protein
MTTIKERVNDAPVSRWYGDGERAKKVHEILAIRIATLQEVVIGLDYLMKAVRGDDSIRAGRDFRFHYDQINNAENFRRVRGFGVMLNGRNDFLDNMKIMMENVNEEVNGSISTPPNELIRELSEYLEDMKTVLLLDNYTPQDFDRLIGRESKPHELDEDEQL